MKRHPTNVALALGSLALVAALAPSPRAPDEAGEIKALAQAKVNLAREILAQYREYLVAPPGEKGLPSPVQTAEMIQDWIRKLADARLEAADNRDERIAILTEEVKTAKEFEQAVKDLLGGNAGGMDKMTASKAEFARLEAEIRLAREKATK